MRILNSSTVKSSRLFSSSGFLQLVKLTSYKLKEWAVFQWSCSSAVSTVTMPNTQIILLNYGWVSVCLFSCCKTLPSCGFCSTALTAVAQTQQTGNAPLLISHFRSGQVMSVSHWCGPLVRCLSKLILFCFLVSRDYRGTYRCLASQWVTADWWWWLSKLLAQSLTFSLVYMCLIQCDMYSIFCLCRL